MKYLPLRCLAKNNQSVLFLIPLTGTYSKILFEEVNIPRAMFMLLFLSLAEERI